MVAFVLAISIGFGYIIDALFLVAKFLLRSLGSLMFFLFDRLLAPILMGLAFVATLFWELIYSIFSTSSSPISETPPQYVEEIREAAELKSLPPYAEVFLWLVAVAIIGFAFSYWQKPYAGQGPLRGSPPKANTNPWLMVWTHLETLLGCSLACCLTVG